MTQDPPNVYSKFVIIGNSAGAVGAIEAIRQVHKEDVITVVSDEPYAVYSRPLISEYLSGEKGVKQMLYRPINFYEKNGVNPILDAQVERIDFEARKIWFANKEEFEEPLEYDKLLLATGGVPFVPPMEGLDKKGIHTFVTLEDAKAIRDEVEKAEKVLVVGGGLIGISVTEALVKLGKQVTIVELLGRVLSMNLDKAASGLMHRRLYEKGVELITDNSVERFVGLEDDDDVLGSAELKMGMKVDCDMAVIAIGVRPRIELVRNTKVEVDRGILVDRHMETKVPGVYACGDVAQAYDFVWDENRLSPIWPNAYLGGRTAGRNMVGHETEYPGSTGMTSFTYFDLPMISAGMHSIPKEETGRTGEQEDASSSRYEVMFKSEPQKGFYRKVLLKDGLIKGFIMVKDLKGAGILTDLMRDKVDVKDFKGALLSEEFGLAHLPKAMLPGRLRGVH